MCCELVEPLEERDLSIDPDDAPSYNLLCPKCGFLVSARYNYCSSCRFELHRTCGNCQREVGVADRFCPYCANDLTPSAAVEPGSMNLA